MINTPTNHSKSSCTRPSSPSQSNLLKTEENQKYTELARRDLLNYQLEKQAISYLQIKIGSLKDRMRHTRSYAPSAVNVQTQSNYRFLEDLFAEIAYLENKYAQQMIDSERSRAAIETRIFDSFPAGDPKGMLLYYKYCCCLNHVAIAPKIGYSVSRTNHLHCEALIEYGKKLANQHSLNI